MNGQTASFNIPTLQVNNVSDVSLQLGTRERVNYNDLRSHAFFLFT